MVKHLTCSTLVQLFGMVACVMLAACASVGMNEKHAKPVASDKALFLEMLPFGNSVERRRQVAGLLATEFSSSPWIVWILTSDDPFMWGNLANETTAALDRAVLAALLENLPNNVSPSILMAVTTQLDCTERGIYPGRRYMLGSTRMSSHATRPLQEIAFDVLTRSIDADHGHDSYLWRQEILSIRVDAD